MKTNNYPHTSDQFSFSTEEGLTWVAGFNPRPLCCIHWWQIRTSVVKKLVAVRFRHAKQTEWPAQSLSLHLFWYSCGEPENLAASPRDPASLWLVWCLDLCHVGVYITHKRTKKTWNKLPWKGGWTLSRERVGSWSLEENRYSSVAVGAIWQGCLLGKVYWAYPTGRRPQGTARGMLERLYLSDGLGTTRCTPGRTGGRTRGPSRWGLLAIMDMVTTITTCLLAITFIRS